MHSRRSSTTSIQDTKPFNSNSAASSPRLAVPRQTVPELREDEIISLALRRPPPLLRESTTPHVRQPKTYASLPPSPISPSPPPSFVRPLQTENSAPFSLWDYLREEIFATDFDSHQEMKWERVSNFLSVPVALEKIIIFGFILCFDSFLYTFTISPIRFVLACARLFRNAVAWRTALPLPSSQKADILRVLLLVVSIFVLAPLTNASKIYHFIRGQDTIKLYVIFNALEIADRLFTSFGQDILDCLFSRSTLRPLSRHLPFTAQTLRPLVFFVLAAFYTVGHTLVLIYQLTSLNVAINSYDHSLLTLLVSNQFVEIKGSVFKKFEKDNLFQITCADIVERFQLALMLVSIAVRNLIELTGSEFDYSDGPVLPKSFNWVQGRNIVWTIFSPVMAVLVSELVVDWLKHAFITKFNHIRPSVYERYMDVLCRDLVSGSAMSRRARKHTYVDQSPVVARRLGFASVPNAVLSVLIGYQSINLLSSSSTTRDPVHTVQWLILGALFWLCLVIVKILLGVNLVSYAAKRQMGMEAREAEDAVNDFGRNPIGEGKDEQRYNRELKTLLNRALDDVAPISEMGERRNQVESRPGGEAGEQKRRLPLEELTRFTMVKRIW